MKIGLIDCRSDGHHSQYASILCATLEQAGVDTFLCMPAAAIEQARRAGISAAALELAEVRTEGLRKQVVVLQQYARALRDLRRWGATHFHFLFVDGQSPAIWEAARQERLAAKLRLTVHWVSGVGIATRGVGIKEPLKRWALKSLLHSGARALVHHRDLVDPLEICAGQGRVDVAPYPVRPLPAPDEAAISQYRLNLGIPRDAILLLCFGDTSRYKGADLAINALAQLDQEFYLLIAGNPTQITEPEMNGLAERLGVADRVRIVGRFIPEEEIGVCFHAADVVLLSYRSGFSGQSGPLTLAGAAGRVVVAPASVVISATVREYRLGFLYESENIEAMVRAVRLAAAARKRPDASPRPRTEQFMHDHSCTAFGMGVLRSYLAN